MPPEDSSLPTPLAPPKRRRRRKPGDKRDAGATRRALLASGASLFPERGYDGVSIEDLAKRARVNRALISYHFGGKRGLYVAVLESGFAEMADRLRSVDEAPDAREGLRRLFAAFEVLTRERPDFPALFVREAVSRGIEPAVIPHLLQIIDITRRLAERGRREGSFREVDPLLFHFGFVGALAFFFATEPARRRAAPHLPFQMPTPGAFIRHLEEMTLRGLAPGAAPAPKTKTNKRKKGGALMKRSCVVVLALVPLAAACGRDGEDGRILASGYVEATEVMLSTKVGGTLERLHVDEGAIVEGGQEIARIDTVDTLLALESAKAERAQAGAELSLRLAGAREEDILEAKAQLARAEADLAGAARDLERMEGLLAAGSGTTKSRDDARTRHEVAAASVQAARERLRRIEAGFRQEEIAAARARVQAADAGIARLEQQLEDAVVRAPVAGIVTRKLSEQGELMAPGTGLVVVTDLANAWLNAYIPEPDLGRIRLGQEAEVVTDDGQTRKGTVSFIASRAEFTPKNVQTRDERVKLVFRIKVALDNEDGLFKPGMPAEAYLLPGSPAR